MKTDLIILSLFIVLALNGWWVDKNFDYPYPPPVNIVTEKTAPLDFAGFLFGMRRIVADVNWIQTIQYYGGGGYEDEVTEEEYKKYADDPKRKGEYGRYRYLLDMCRKCVRIDPYFKFVYAYGGTSLAWNLTRYDEAIELLNEGIENNPDFYPFHLYAAAIVFFREGKFEKVIEKLEEAVKYPDCPFKVKLILGNIYNKQGKYEKAANIWVDVYFTAKKTDEIETAKYKLTKLITQKRISQEFMDELLTAKEKSISK
ncbi:MAG: tetratricopeptide repeat protein [Elusimicrobia bacterium]|nr:tetratricopeptide repeat protein [Elusimicrobiota bacterium]